MRRAPAGAAGALLLGVLALAAPALSLEPYRPQPVEFGIPAPPDRFQATRAGAVLSEPVRAPRRFNLVGFTWKGSSEPAIAVRVRPEDGEWGEWTRVPAHVDGAPDPGGAESTIPAGASAPVWAGQADFVQYRFSRRPRGLRLEFVNTTGTATVADRVETAVRSVVSDAVIAVGGLAAAEAGGRQPKMVSRSAWGAEDCVPRRKPSYGEVRAAFVHHTVTANDYSPSQARAMVLGICRYHRNTLGWDDIGYNFLVDRFGTLYEGRAGGLDQAVIGAQSQGFNDQSTGVASLGTHSSSRLSGRAVRAVARLIRWKLPLHGQPTKGRATLVSDGGRHSRFGRGERVRVRRISGHRDVGVTDCPGGVLYRQLRRIRRLSDAVAPQAPTALRARRRGRRVRLDWADNPERDLSGYRVYLARRSGTGSREIAATRESRFVHRRRKRGRTYTYSVRAFDRARNLSPPSTEVTVTLPRR